MPGTVKTGNAKLDAVADVDIDQGKFKYILIKVHDPNKDRESKYIVRGYSRAEFHADIYDEVEPSIEGLGLDCECVGGGRMIHDPDKKSIQVFGYSQGYGRADHSISAGILKKNFPSYTSITWSNDGY
ncbi:14 kDa phosphohistidine phosphatase [Lingula anatina]|uniref:14 kDa phosphohistidine phosphatase n=1 Tax=Lingula anatina TaxID=7574 RepID=A0A1S3HTG6_LINAN|nr:14 kDa phosphohistidine phosphatase [Lingula anatina]|eukprot:XP_013388841.1 14 kDa phosphohistidine phosphatase [Lingula anatina]